MNGRRDGWRGEERVEEWMGGWMNEVIRIWMRNYTLYSLCGSRKPSNGVSFSDCSIGKLSFLGESPESVIRDSLGDVQHPNNASKKEKNPHMSPSYFENKMLNNSLLGL